MKKSFGIILILIIAALLCACGAEEANPMPEEAPRAEKPAEMESVLPGQNLVKAEESDGVDVKELADRLLGYAVSEMTDALGAPDGTEEVPNCLGDGSRFVYHYDEMDLQIHTYKEGDREIVTDVVVNEGTDQEIAFSIDD